MVVMFTACSCLALMSVKPNLFIAKSYYRCYIGVCLVTVCVCLGSVVGEVLVPSILYACVCSARDLQPLRAVLARARVCVCVMRAICVCSVGDPCPVHAV